MIFTQDDFEWAWEQVPDIKAIEAMERAGYVAKPWDRCWLYAGPLWAPNDPTTLCPCMDPQDDDTKVLFEQVLVHLDHKLALIDDGTGTGFRLAWGECRKCKRLYWQTDNHNAAVGFK